MIALFLLVKPQQRSGYREARLLAGRPTKARVVSLAQKAQTGSGAYSASIELANSGIKMVEA